MSSYGQSVPADAVWYGAGGGLSFDRPSAQDVTAEKVRDVREVGATMNAWEHRQKWYGEDEKTAKSRARGLEKGGDSVLSL